MRQGENELFGMRSAVAERVIPALEDYLSGRHVPENWGYAWDHVRQLLVGAAVAAPAMETPSIHIDLLQRALDHSEPSIRLAGIYAVGGMFPANEAADRLLRHANAHPEDGVSLIVSALGTLTGCSNPSLLARYVEMVVDGSTPAVLRTEAVRSLSEVSRSSELGTRYASQSRRLLDAFDTANPEEQASLAESIGLLAGRNIEPVLRERFPEFTEHTDNAVRNLERMVPRLLRRGDNDLATMALCALIREGATTSLDVFSSLQERADVPERIRELAGQASAGELLIEPERAALATPRDVAEFTRVGARIRDAALDADSLQDDLDRLGAWAADGGGRWGSATEELMRTVEDRTVDGSVRAYAARKLSTSGVPVPAQRMTDAVSPDAPDDLLIMATACVAASVEGASFGRLY
jgi:hypothetical protein